MNFKDVSVWTAISKSSISSRLLMLKLKATGSVGAIKTFSGTGSSSMLELRLRGCLDINFGATELDECDERKYI